MRFILQICGKKSLLILFFTSFVILLLELISIALIFPFLNLFVAPDDVLKNRYVGKLYSATGFTDVNNFIYIVGIIMIVVYLMRLFIKTTINFIKNRTTNDLTYRLSSQLFRGLLGSRYSLFTEQSISEMVNIVNVQTIHSVICLDSFVKILNELAFVLIILGFMFYINPFVTFMSTLLFAVIGVILYVFIVRRIEEFGETHAKLSVLAYKYGFAMASSIKDIKIMRLEDKYSSKFLRIWGEYSRNDSKSKTAKEIPVDLSLTLIFSGIIAVCLYVRMTKQNMVNMVPFLGVLAISAIRVLPSFNRIISGYNEFRYYKPALQLVKDLYKKIAENQQKIEHLKLPFSRCLEIRRLNFCYGEKCVLKSVDVQIEKGGSYAFVGVSGSGKSTLLDVLVGLREAEEGEFYLDAVRFDPFGTDALRSRIGYVPQNVNLIDESMAFNISFEIDYDREKMRRVISIARLEEFVESLPDRLATILGESGVRVSGGQKQRIGIARALYRDPEILVFDEATSALDAVTERQLMQEINQLSGEKTLIIVAHRLSTVENCTVIHLLDSGRIIARGTQAELLQSSPEYRALYQHQEQSS